MYAWRRSANRVFARSACSINECLLRAICSRHLHVCRQIAPMSGGLWFAQMQRSESPAELMCTRCRRPVRDSVLWITAADASAGS